MKINLPLLLKNKNACYYVDNHNIVRVLWDKTTHIFHPIEYDDNHNAYMIIDIGKQRYKYRPVDGVSYLRYVWQRLKSLIIETHPYNG